MDWINIIIGLIDFFVAHIDISHSWSDFSVSRIDFPIDQNDFCISRLDLSDDRSKSVNPFYLWGKAVSSCFFENIPRLYNLPLTWLFRVDKRESHMKKPHCNT